MKCKIDPGLRLGHLLYFYGIFGIRVVKPPVPVAIIFTQGVF